MSERAIVVGEEFPADIRMLFGSVAKFVHPTDLRKLVVAKSVRLLVVYGRISQEADLVAWDIANSNRLEPRAVESRALLEGVLGYAGKMTGKTYCERPHPKQ